jgi:GT2 family glycosyltransferase
MEEALPLVSIVILNYNGRKFVDNCFSSLAKLSYPKDRYEVIVVDNDSSDGSVEYIQRRFGWVKIVRLNKNYGFAGGNNIGINYANGDYVVFLNNDVIVDQNWLIELVKYVKIYPDAMVTSKALLLEKPHIINHDGSKATLIGKGFCINFGKENRVPQNPSPKFVVQPYGASMMVKKAIFEEIGMFDEDYFISLEDLDIGLRMWLFGYRVAYVPASIFYHFVGASGGEGSYLSETLIYHSTKNSYMNILKYFDFPHITQGILLSLIYYTCWSIWLIKKNRNPEAPKLILSAHIWIVRNIGTIIKKRTNIRRKSKMPRSFLFQSSFFASVPEMIKEQISLWNTNYMK